MADDRDRNRDRDELELQGLDIITSFIYIKAGGAT
jgi:hypothetical protein